MTIPLGAGETGAEGVFQGTVETLNHSVTLRVKTGCSRRRNPQGGANSGPDGGGELRATIGGEGGWYSET